MGGGIMIKTEGKENIPSQKENNSSCRLRKLLQLILSYSPPRVDEITCSAEGDIKFAITRTDVGLNYESYCFYRTEILSDYFINLLGELIVKDNIEMFAKMLTDIKDYSVVNKYEHGKFGIEVYGEKLYFTLHISLIQRILTEDFRKEIKKKAK
jgi:hypothetical protein